MGDIRNIALLGQPNSGKCFLWHWRRHTSNVVYIPYHDSTCDINGQYIR